MDIPGITPEFLENYQRLCWSPLRDAEDITKDLQKLFTLPHVRFVTFWQPPCGSTSNTLLIGTDMVKIKNDMTGRYHDIGEFIIFLTRRRSGRVWEASFRLSNLNTVGEAHTPGEFWSVGKNSMHPHMSVTEDPELRCWVANICIESGHQAIYQHIRRGELKSATELIIELLHTYQKGRAFPGSEIYHWPLSKENAP